ncbi:MAG TPA: hypothetical protein VMV88_03465 [Gallionella sp.]|nr:hypothetical protein [Gallionella sp.]
MNFPVAEPSGAAQFGAQRDTILVHIKSRKRHKVDETRAND